MIDVVIPARNTAATIGPVVKVCAESPDVNAVIIGIDPPFIDRTVSIVRDLAEKYHNIIWYRAFGEGKGENCQRGLKRVTTPRVMFCDSDISGLTARHVTELAAPREGMVIATREHPVTRVPIRSNANGERSLPTEIARSLSLHGYLMEWQINDAIARAGLPVYWLIAHGLTTDWTVTKERCRAAYSDFLWARNNDPHIGPKARSLAFPIVAPDGRPMSEMLDRKVAA